MGAAKRTQDSDPVVSIITAVRNGMPFISTTLDSVINQTYPKIEYIVVDGASTDGTLDAVRKHEGRISKWVSEPDQGIADAFNKGLRLSSGEYLMFLNSDDWLSDPDSISRLVAAARELHWPQVIYGDCDIYDRSRGSFTYRASVPYSRRRLLRGGALPHPGLLTHRDYFSKYGEFDISFRIAMDYELFVRGVPWVGADYVSVLVTNVRADGVSARNRNVALEEIFRALRKNKHLSYLSELRLRGYYFGRHTGRKLLEAIGLRRKPST